MQDVKGAAPSTTPSRQQWGLSRYETIDSPSSSSSTVNTDFLTEEQRENVRRWLGPGQLLLINEEMRAEKGVDLPDESLVAGEILLVLRKLASPPSGKDGSPTTLQVTLDRCRSLSRTVAAAFRSPSGGSCEADVQLYAEVSLLTGHKYQNKSTKRRTKAQRLDTSGGGGGGGGANFAETFAFGDQTSGSLLQVCMCAMRVVGSGGGSGGGASGGGGSKGGSRQRLGEAVICLDDCVNVGGAAVQSWYKLLHTEGGRP